MGEKVNHFLQSWADKKKKKKKKKKFQNRLYLQEVLSVILTIISEKFVSIQLQI